VAGSHRRPCTDQTAGPSSAGGCLSCPTWVRQFQQDEPWDGPHNQVFVGKGTAFEGHQGLRLPDGTANTILVAEAGEAAVGRGL
jgi:hypothetical protein